MSQSAAFVYPSFRGRAADNYPHTYAFVETGIDENLFDERLFLRFASSAYTRSAGTAGMFLPGNAYLWLPIDNEGNATCGFVFWKESNYDESVFLAAKVPMPSPNSIYRPSVVSFFEVDRWGISQKPVAHLVRLDKQEKDCWFVRPTLLQGFQVGMLDTVQEYYSQPGTGATTLSSLSPLGVLTSTANRHALLLWASERRAPYAWQCIGNAGSKSLGEIGEPQPYLLHGHGKVVLEQFERHQRAILFSGLEGIV